MRDDGRKRTFRQMERFYETKELVDFSLVESLLNDPGQVILSVFPMIIYPSEDRFKNKEEYKKYMEGFELFKKNIIKDEKKNILNHNRNQEKETCLCLQRFLKGETFGDAVKRLVNRNFIIENRDDELLWFLYDYHKEAKKHTILALVEKTRSMAFSQYLPFQQKFFFDVLDFKNIDNTDFFNETTRILVSKKFD